MTMVAESARPLFVRLWVYQAERFPLVKHGLLIAAFATSGVCVSALLRGSTPDPRAILVALVVLFGFFVQLRVADEHKDLEDDTRFRPERPVPRGLVTLGELRAVALIAAAVQIAATWALHPPLLAALALVWGWMALMSAEFFAPAWLKARPLLYLVSHMAIMPLIDLYATACDWAPAEAHRETFGFGLAAFLALSFANGAVIEIARKSWAPEDEREGVDTYSKLWGRPHAGAAIGLALAGGLIAALLVAWATEASFVALIAILVAAGGLFAALLRYLRTPSSAIAKKLELFAGLWVLVSYVALGAPGLWAAFT
jgi:4-hydroxybenzoate polyprenyltransferase